MVSLRFKRILVLSCAFIAIAAVCPFRVMVVCGSSMAPALHNRQIAVMERGIHGTRQLERGDVVAFRLGGEVLVKRVYAVPGDVVNTIRFTNGLRLIAYEAPIPMDKLKHYARVHPGSVRFERTVVPSDKVYVLGDNRCRSVDSRVFGAVACSDVLGRVYTPAEAMDAVAALPSRLSRTASAHDSVRSHSL